MAVCSISTCRGQHYAHGLCSKHYQRRRNTGSEHVSTTRRTAADWLLDAIVSSTPEICVAWPFAIHNGYGVLRVGGRNWQANRLVCELAHGNPPAGHFHAAHSCGHSVCVNPHHLRWATPAENQADRLIHGTDNRGERYGLSKLTEAAVHEIRALASEGTPQRTMARRFGVSQGTISDVVRRRSWGWL